MTALRVLQHIWVIAFGSLVACNAVFGMEDLYYAAAPPTCDDGLQNGNETDVDCGARCEPCVVQRRCDVAADCTSHLCEGGVCSECQRDDDCDDGVCRDERCDGPGDLGAACTRDEECTSGFCPPQDGVCCDTPCALVCEACTAAKTGNADGLCDFVDRGLHPDPDAECSATPPSTCGAAGEGCETNATRCVLHGPETVCREATCISGIAQDTSRCSGNGTCALSPEVACGNFVCSDSVCLESCNDAMDCIDSAYCDGDDCRPKKPQGAPCNGNEECVSNSCVMEACAAP